MYIYVHESRVILKEPLKFSARIFEEGFSLSTKGGEGESVLRCTQ